MSTQKETPTTPVIDKKKAMKDRLYGAIMDVLKDGRPVAGGEDGPIMGPPSAADFTAAMKYMDTMDLDLDAKSDLDQAMQDANKRARAKSQLASNDPFKIAQ